MIVQPGPFLKDLFGSLAARPAVEGSLKTFTLVGAFAQCARGVHTLEPKDALYLEHALRMLDSLDIAVGQRPVLNVVNLEYGHDFLANPPASDAILFCFLFYDPSAVHLIGKLSRQSPLASEDAAWNSAMIRSGAKMAINFSKGDSELPTRLLSRPPFELVHTSPRCTYDIDMVAHRKWTPALRGL